MDTSLTKDNKEDAKKIEAPSEGLATLIGKDSSYLVKLFGEPERIDPSDFGYEWWIYNKGLSEYMQVGVLNKQIVTVYAIGSHVNISPFRIGQPVDELFSSIPIEPDVNLEFDGSSYRFELTEDDMNTRPLLPIGDFFVQIYIDKFDGTLSSIRFVDAETLLKLQPYELVYLGELLEVSPLDLAGEDVISAGSAKQILDITNIMRLRHQLNALEWDEDVTEVAFAHSKDMFESNEFSHISKQFGELADRLDAKDVFYQLAGENIAANYTDAPAVMEGWLNSKGHRETLLNSQFTHIGIGVYNRHYTQNFIQKWAE